MEIATDCGLAATVTLSHAASLSRLGFALADERRARILLALRERPAYPSELALVLGASKQVVSNQLACLRGCGLVVAEKEGRRAMYSLVDERLVAALGELLELSLVVDPDCCSEGGCTCG